MATCCGTLLEPQHEARRKGRIMAVSPGGKVVKVHKSDRAERIARQYRNAVREYDPWATAQEMRDTFDALTDQFRLGRFIALCDEASALDHLPTSRED